MRAVNVVLMTAGLVLISATASLAQFSPALPTVSAVPRLIDVTGVFQPANGQPPLAAVMITLTIYSQQDGGAPLWRETQTVALDRAGRFTAHLGATQVDGIPSEVFASGDAKWLGIQFEGTGEMEQPRVLIASVPYALRASDAEMLGGRPASAYLLAPTDGATEGFAARTADSTPNRSTSSTPLDSTSTVLPGTPNFLAKYVNGSDIGTSAVYEIGGSLGVGTTAPADALHVRFTNTSGAMTGIAVQNLGNAAMSYSGMLFYDQNGVLGHFQGFSNATHEYRLNNVAPGGSVNFMIGGASRLAIRNNGDVVLGGPLYFGTADAPFLHTGAPNPAYNNTFVGTAAGSVAVTGQANVGVGLGAMHYTTSGQSNVAVGALSLGSNRTGWNNVAIGDGALGSTFAESNNTAVGISALGSSQANSNTGIGANAGAWTGFGGNNIYVGADVKGDASDANTIYIGKVGTQLRTFMAGIRGTTTGLANAVPVVIDSAGQLGTVSSSRRFKEDIQDMGEVSQRLMQLRPVTFHYRQAFGDGSKPIQFGLVAEEVAETFPELAVRDSAGAVETVHYETLNVLLLNELQHQQRRIEALEEEMRELRRQFTNESTPKR